jgi:diguanylate cyclase (GGDEF)-like protein
MEGTNISSATKPPGFREKPGFISNAVGLAAVALFAANGSIVVPAALGLDGSDAGVDRSLLAAFLLNIALLLFAWRKTAELRDTSEARARAERDAYGLAYVDHTTGLFNRRHIAEELDRICATADPRVALLLLDLDHFKRVNDFYGHSAGDALLMSAAEVIRRNVPASACCGRLGGDEFGIVIRGDDSQPERVCAIAQRLLNELSRPIPIGPTLAHISASIGISVLDQSCERAEWLLRRSDIAMYEAKRLGRNCFVWFDCEMEVQLNRRNAVEADMRVGLSEHRFVPYFQPLIDLDSGELKGFEVLARWNHATRGLLEPADFIDVAEGTGLISHLSMSVMRQALNEARAWPSHLSIAVNVSPVQFRDPMLAQRIVKMLAETNFPAQRLELEITESTLLEDHDLALATVESLKNHGIRISLDDFGTGYASLTQLRSLPFDRIKIDRSFVATIMEDKQSHAIVSAIANLGKNLRLPVTAEGVESACVHGKLQQLGCSDAQGWLFGRPLPAAEARELLGPSVAEAAAEGDAEESYAPPTKERRDHGRRGSSASAA